MDNTSMDSQARLLTAEQDKRLDQLLAEWRQRHLLAPDVAEQVRGNALATTDALPETWWAAFAENMHWIATAVHQVPAWERAVYGIDNQLLHDQREFKRYQQNYWRPVTVSL